MPRTYGSEAPWTAAALAAVAALVMAAGCGGERAGRRRAWQGALHAEVRRLPRARRTRAPRASRGRTSTSRSSSRSRTASAAARSRAWSGSRSTCRRAARCRPTSSRARTPTRSPPTWRARSASRAAGGAAARPVRHREGERAERRRDPDRPDRPARLQVQERRGEGRQGDARVQERLLGAAQHRDQGRPRGPGRPGRQDLEDHGEPEGRQATRSTAACPATSRPG